MTTVVDPALAQKHPDVFQSRTMWIKTPHEVMHHKKMSVTHEQIKHQGIYIFGGYNQHRECTTNALYVLKPDY